MGIIRKVLEGIKGLSSRHVAFYLLKAPASETQELADALLEVRRKIRPCGR